MHRRLLDLTRDTRLALSLTILSGLMAGWLTIGQSYVLSRTISDVFLKGLTLAEVWPWMRILLAIISGRGVLAWVSELAADSVAIRIKTDLRERLFAHILRLGPAYSRGERTGELTAAAVEGIESLDAYFSQYLPQLVVSTLVPVSILMLVFPLDPLSGIVLVLTAPLIPFFMYMIGRGAEAVTKRQYETLSKLSAHFLDSLQGLTTLKLFGQSKAQARNIAHISDQYRDATLQVLQVTFLSAFALELLATISTAIIAVEVGLRLLYGQMQFQQALFLLILAPEFYLPLRMLGLRFHAGMAGTSAARRIFEILDLRVDGFHEFAPGAGTRTGAMRKSDAFRLELCDVSYTYPGEKEPALKDVTLSLRAGQHIAVVGPSGAGKTTLVNVLLRFVEPTLGGITLNGDPLCNVPVEEWRDLIAWVPQSPHLFHDSIAANIRFGNNGASDQELMAAAMAAHLDEFVGSLPDGYDTVIGEAGARLSSGQAQRLALARAFAKDAPILILDEPTSNLDPETESLLEDSTRRLMAGRTVITVAHRLNTVVHADQIIVLKDGSVVEAGTHRELLQRNGVYSRTVKIQHSADQIPGDNLILRPEAFSYRPAPRVHQPAYSQQSESPEVRAAEDTSMRHPSVLFRLLTFLDGSWGWVALSVLLGSFTIGSGVALMAASSWLISTAALHPSIAALELAIAGVRFFGIARAVFRYFERLVSHNVTFRLLGRLRAWFYESLEPLAPARLMEYRAGDLLARIVSDVNTLENFYVRVVGPPATAILVGLGAALFLSAIDPPLAAVLLASFLLLGWILPVVVLRMSKHRSLEAVAQRSELQAQLVDGIQGISDILAFGQGPPRVAQIQATGKRYADAQRQLGMIGGAQTAVVTLITGLASWLILCIAIPAVASGQIPGVMLAPLALLASSSFEAVAPLSVAAQAWSSTREAARRLFDVVDAAPAVQEKGERGAVVNQRLPGNRAVEFSDVSFSYPGKETPVLQHVSFGLKAGETLAVVGTSGAGKSTLASLLLRFWDFELGEIWLHGKSIKALAPEEVRARIALISPSTYFFNTSIYENLRMARRGVSREDVEGAARAAQIHDFIMGLPEGYDTAIGEQGMRLSGGERQRLAVARAILKDAPILVMDEPTANLDALSESLVIASLSGWMERKSTLWITHRLVGLERVHEILVLDHGQIVERGSHGSLLNGHGLYRRLWDLQNQYLGDDERA